MTTYVHEQECGGHISFGRCDDCNVVIVLSTQPGKRVLCARCAEASDRRRQQIEAEKDVLREFCTSL